MKKIISILLVCSMVLALVGCGSGTAADKGQAASPATEGTFAAAVNETEPVPQVQPVTEEMLLKREMDRAEELGFAMEGIGQSTISGQQMMVLADKMLETAAPEAVAQWQQMYPLLRANAADLTRFDAMAYIFLAAQHIGGDYRYVKNDPWMVGGSYVIDWDRPYLSWDLYGDLLGTQFDIGGPWGGPLESSSYNYMLGQSSFYTGEMPFEYDAASNSLRVSDLCTYEEAVRAIIRVMASIQPEIMNSGDTDQMDPLFLSDALIAQAQQNPITTAENHPKWTGFVLGWDENVYDSASVENIHHIADWGFNSVRLQIDYKNLFDPNNGLEGKYEGLHKLDCLIGAALERNIHLDICLCDLPGRDNIYDDATATSWGEFDLYINPEQQEKAYQIWGDLARRYQDIPSYNLTFTVLWESTNPDMSTGLPAPDYTDQDVADYLAEAIDAIRAEDPDRMIIYEHAVVTAFEDIRDRAEMPHQVAMEKGNVLTSYNYGEGAFIYRHMTAEEGQHIDNNNHSLLTPQYPAYYYMVDEQICFGSDLVMDGFLPAGTTINLYLKESYGTTAEIRADDTVLLSETINGGAFRLTNQLSRFVRFTQSNKVISVTLPEKAEKVTFTASDGGFTWCGMEVILPEQYAVEQWFYASPYDVLIGLQEESGVMKMPNRTVLIWPVGGGNEITIHEDVTFSTPYTYDEASRERHKQLTDSMAGFDGNCIVRFETAAFSGVEWSEMKEYYIDLLDMFQEKNFSWWSNDFGIMTTEHAQTQIVAESPSMEYEGFEFFNLELLELLQKYQ